MLTLSALETLATDLYIQYNSTQAALAETTEAIKDNVAKLGHLEVTLNEFEKVKPYIDLVIEKFSDSTIKNLETLLTISLQKIFFDREYAVVIKTVEKRNLRCAELYLVENDQLYSMENSSVAGGILVVVGFIIQVFYVANLTLSKIIFSDEAFTNISTKYLDPFFAFIQELSEQIGLTVVLITHDKRFVPYGQKVYSVNGGHFSVEEG